MGGLAYLDLLNLVGAFAHVVEWLQWVVYLRDLRVQL